MKNTLKINHEDRTIVMNRTFAKAAEDTFSPEYAHLQQVRKDYPLYQVVQKTIKKNKDKETYKGLTYEYMIDYIATHEPKETRKEVLDEFAELKLISQCHATGKRYPVIKKWFLKKYPQIAMFGVEESAKADSSNTTEKEQEKEQSLQFVQEEEQLDKAG